ncbi:MAG TPA: hypothetical protein VFA20_27265 [Myxococcaceae bacterium]|nr:hypothetical protein [Myxococcaceae bacterium]
MDTLPPLLETYEEARLLLEAKGWVITKAAEHLSEMPEMARFHISHTKFSRKTTPGADKPIEPEVATAVEGLKTWPGYERKTDIVTKGLLARRGARPLPASLRLGQRAFRFLRQLAERFGRAFWTRIAVTAASGAVVAVLLVPLLAGAARPGPFVLVLPGAGPDGSTVSFDPRSLIDLPVAWGEKPLDQPIPVKTLPGQRAAPCDTDAPGQVVINGNCWLRLADAKPPCGIYFRQGDACYAPVAEPKKPTHP